jgi:MAC/Perforin domain
MTDDPSVATGNRITGCGVLGYGFNIFGEYGDESVLRPMMDLGAYDGAWTSPVGIEYLVPTNIDVNSATGAQGSVSAFSSKENFTSHFAAKAGVKGSYGAFTGEFDASFTADSASESEYVYGLYEQVIDAWSLTVRDWSAESLLPAVTRDPDFAALPHTYTQQNKYLFFRFFVKYGTHLVTRVGCGARMSYAAQVAKSYTSSTTEITAKLSAEFRGVFADGTVDAQNDFKTADQRWFDSRQVTIRTTGGDTSLVGSIAPSHGVNDNAPFEAWLASAEREPAPITFQLTPVSALFSAERAAAVNTAYNAYANCRLLAESRRDGYTLLLSGTPLQPPQKEAKGVVVAVIDRADLSIRLLKFYDAIGWPPGDEVFWGPIAKDLKPYTGDTDFVLALATSGWSNYAIPTSAMIAILESCGAGAGLADWRKDGALKFQGGLNYALLGVMGVGPGLGIEAFRHAEDFVRDPGAASAAGLLLPMAEDNGEDELEFVLQPL